MNAIMNETQLWYFDTCDKTNNFKSKSKHNNSKTHIHQKEYDSVVRDHEFT